MKIALMGSRGIPACYSGFETFYEQLAVRLAERGHDVTVYNRSFFIKKTSRAFKGVRLVSLPSVPTKHLDTITHTLISSVHALFQKYDITYFCIVGNSPLIWLPRITGARTLLNVDGEDWSREKWSGFARWYQKQCEWVATKSSQVIIADAREIKRRYKKEYSAETIFVPYGANIKSVAETDVLEKWGLTPGEYILYVGRLVPENSIDLLIRAFTGVKTDKKLVIIGDAPFSQNYRNYLKSIADKRVVFTGYAFGRDYTQLSSHAYFYVQPSAIDGTRPALLDQMGFGNCVLVRSSKVNMEVIGDYGCWFDGENPLSGLTGKINQLVSEPEMVEASRKRVTERIKNYYNWEWITDFYENLFERILCKKTLVSYDSYLEMAGIDNGK